MRVSIAAMVSAFSAIASARRIISRPRRVGDSERQRLALEGGAGGAHGAVDVAGVRRAAISAHASPGGRD